MVFQTYTTKTACWANPSQNCTWTPPVNSTTGRPTTSNSDGGGCCDYNKRWNGINCESTSGLCTIPWITGTVVQFSADGPFKYSNGQYQYCAKVISGVNYGFWDPIESY